MRGRNKREDSRRTQREKRKHANEMAKRDLSEKKLQLSTILPPRSSIDDWAPIRFAGRGIDSEGETLLSNLFVYNFFASEVTPMERTTNLDCLESSSFLWLFTDTTFLHSVLCARYAIKDFMSPQWDGKPGLKTVFHLRETVSLLRVKVQNEHAHHDESVLRVIVNLTLLATVLRDWKAVAAHLEGLLKIVQLRGNALFLKTRPTLHFKLDRIDLAWYLSTGQRPYFIQPIESWSRKIVLPKFPLSSNCYRPSASWDYRLTNVFNDFQYLASRINRNKLKFVVNDPAIFQNDLTSLQTRLILLAELVTEPIEEMVRLTMLAVLTTTFRYPGRKIPYDWVVRQLELKYIAAGSEVLQEKSLMIWVLLISSFTVSDVHSTWIRDAWSVAASGLKWADVKAHVLRVVWIEIVHNKPGQTAYEQLEMSNMLA